MTSLEEPAEVPDLASSVADAVARVQGGETGAFAIVVKTYERRLMSLCLAMLGDFTTAEEVTQEAFMRAFRYLDTYDPPRSFYPWLAKIAVRLVQQVRSRRRTPELPLTGDVDRTHSMDHPLTTLIRDERSRGLWATVLELPPHERAAVVLFYRQELTVRETANALGVTSGTVKTLLFRARRHLRKGLVKDQRRRA